MTIDLSKVDLSKVDLSKVDLSKVEDEKRDMNTDSYVIGVDVGTGSARAGVFDRKGRTLGIGVEPFQTWRPQPYFVEQSSDDIWRAVGVAVRTSLAAAKISPDQVAGISYDATCSLVVLDRSGHPLTVDTEGDNQRNVIVWMDHRATAEAGEIDRGYHDVLRYVGGSISPEMETPKLLWLKRHLPETWKLAGKFLDLADFLVYRSAGIDARSLCTVVCKWTYLGHEGDNGRWDHDFFNSVGLDDLFDGDKVTANVRPIGTAVGKLTTASAKELGLSLDCVVGVGMIDAHAGGLGLLGAALRDKENATSTADNASELSSVPDRLDLSRLETALGLIVGTSSCLMAVSREPRFIPSIWGPYYGAMVPGLWLTEGGESAAGAAIDHVVANHANAAALFQAAAQSGSTPYELLNAEIARLTEAAKLPCSALLTRDIHTLPYYLGNRSPHADPHARGLMDGLSLDDSITTQALQYYATLQSLAYGTREVIETMNANGYRIDMLYVTGGGTKNPLLLQEFADATGLSLALPREPEAVLLGTAMLAAAAAGLYSDVPSAMYAMSGSGGTVIPNAAVSEYHQAKFVIYQELYQQQLARRTQMASFQHQADFGVQKDQ